MSEFSLKSLLQPELSEDQPEKPMYSVRAHIMVAFFAGVFGLLIFSMMSLRQIGRLKPYLNYYLLALLLFGCVFGVIGYLSLSGQLPDWIMIGDSRGKTLRTINRILAVSSFGIIYFFQKNYFSISEMFENPPNPWIPALIATVVGTGISFLMIMLIFKTIAL